MEYIFLGIGISVIALLSYLGIKGVNEVIAFQNSKRKQELNMNEIILLIYIYVDELSNNAIQLTSVWC